ncbi:MAG: PTS sugar transporter subunit IIA [Lentisphaeria bacterium]|nr:PTS sugar transporter subunit IIA [Lentisphaeria bacterium]
MSREEKHIAPVILGNLLTPGRILIRQGKQTKKEVLLALIDAIAAEGEFGSRDELEWGIFHREGMMSTGIGNGIAIPHVLLPNIENNCMALALCPDGIADYQSCDQIPVRMVFMLAAGKSQKVLHLKVLEAIGSLFYDGRLKAAFLAANDPKACLEILARAEN